MGARQAQLNIQTMAADPANSQLKHTIDIKVITDGEHRILDRLDPPYRGLFQMVVAEPASPKHLGLRLSVSLQPTGSNYDLYAYFEDDLIILDPWFFRKIDWFRSQAGDALWCFPIASSWPLGPIPSTAFSSTAPCRIRVASYSPEPEASIGAQWPGGIQYFGLRKTLTQAVSF